MTNIGPSLLVTISGHNIRQILKVSNTVKPNLLKRYGIKNITEATITVFIRFSRTKEIQETIKKLSNTPQNRIRQPFYPCQRICDSTVIELCPSLDLALT